MLIGISVTLGAVHTTPSSNGKGIAISIKIVNGNGYGRLFVGKLSFYKARRFVRVIGYRTPLWGRAVTC